LVNDQCSVGTRLNHLDKPNPEYQKPLRVDLAVAFVAGNPSPVRRSIDQPQYFNIPSTFVFQVKKQKSECFFGVEKAFSRMGDITASKRVSGLDLAAP
jgi:hypothetical protein